VDEITKEFSGGDFDMVKDVEKEALDLTKIRFYLGCSGWGGGRLKGK
jgi:putative AlgH/UPF0301 family transcriptional regulator